MIVLYHPPLVLSLTYEREAHHALPTFFQGYLLRHWFTLSLATSVPFVLLFSYYWIIPESPRWLLSKNRIDEAEVIVQRMAKINGKTVPNNFLRKMEVGTKKRGEDEKRDEGASIFQFRRWRYCGGRGYLATGRIRGTGRGSRARTRIDRHHPRPRLWI